MEVNVQRLTFKTKELAELRFEEVSETFPSLLGKLGRGRGEVLAKVFVYLRDVEIVVRRLRSWHGSPGLRA